MAPRDLRDYVTVNERIAAFKEQFPEGSLQSEIIELGEERVVMRAAAYRTPADEKPGIGHSWLSIPGKTAFTRGSELENAETSAWGRALAALGFEVKRGIATMEEVLNKEDGDEPAPEITESEVTGVERGGRTKDASSIQVRQAKVLSRQLELGTKGFRDAIDRILGDSLDLPDDETAAAAVLVAYLESLSREDIGTLIQGLAAEVEGKREQGDLEPAQEVE